jgi:hypothetical protein
MRVYRAKRELKKRMDLEKAAQRGEAPPPDSDSVS